MMALQLGPVALPVAPLLWLAALWLAHALAQRLAARVSGAGDAGLDPVAARAQRSAAAARAVWHASLWGLAAARAAFIASAPEAYLAAPVLMLDLRDGGWSPLAGVAVGLMVAAWHGWRAAPLRAPLAGALAAGGALWLALAAGVGHFDRPPLPPLVLVGLDGAQVDLAAAAKGRPAVINLWATWCSPCRAEMPLLAAAQQRRGDVRFVYVNQGEPAATVQRYLTNEKLALSQVLLDPSSQLGPLIGSTGLPTTLFVDAQGRIVARHMGLLSSASLAAFLARLDPP